MISHLHSATILVTDQEEALRFYVGKLGWEKREDNRFGPAHRFLTVAPPGGVTAIVLGQPEVYDRAVAPGGTGITVITPDLAAARAEMTAQGVAVGEPQVMPWGAKATWFADPFGNEYFLLEG
ncbi:VOC family protein [Amycolatopsis thermophila]|uniref:Catechol 2,3-dioxygenase-like lactoylglutathione lyase family enzyme n=1 Tax=Amycolatopsis thermophila TaxID=206084 RepID=A0ABU0EPQ1_9PSEU|nr:VOC family protein [Amycolatopsis thermophila]MDQ0377269.1 catechol 2,3-dioxygenase-like lactoylglutathione lyase family enzyme [Amycolatopsis thermophila]